MMRPVCSTLFLGAVFACSGEPFVGVVGHDQVIAGSSGGGGRADGPVPFSPGGGTEHPGVIASGGAAAGTKATSGGAPTSGGAAAGGSGASGVSNDPEMPAAAGAGDAGAAGAPAGPECPTRSGGDWALGFFPELRDVVTQESHPFFQIESLGKSVTTLDRIKIRYYFSKESTLPETAACFWVTGDRCSLAEMHFGDVVKPTAAASRYLEIGFPGASNVMLFPGAFEVRVSFKTGAAPMIQSNDYSFDPDANPPSAATPFPYKRWLQTTLYVDGELVWGTEPCSTTDGP
jgi:hypothetical protein